MTEDPKPTLVEWQVGEKWSHLQVWSQNLIIDRTLSKTAIKVAWLLTFLFNSKTAECWETNGEIAKKINMTDSAVIDALKELELGGYIVREKRWVKALNGTAKLRVFVPSRFFRIGSPDPRRERPKARGGVKKGVNPREKAAQKRAAAADKGNSISAPHPTEIQFRGPTEIQHPCIQEAYPGVDPYPQRPSSRLEEKPRRATELVLDEEIPDPPRRQNRR